VINERLTEIRARSTSQFGVTVHSLRERALLVTPIRLALGLLWLAAARAAGAPPDGATLAFVGGAFFIAFLLLNDPRSRFLRRDDPVELPPEARVAPKLHQALGATLPSTLGVSVLAAIVVVPRPILGALLGGISAGLAVAGGLSGLRTDPSLYGDPKTGAVYRR
jgi:hypothetical protein